MKSRRGIAPRAVSFDAARRRVCRATAVLLSAVLLAAWSMPAATTDASKPASPVSKEAAKRCDTKLKSVEKFGDNPGSSPGRTTRFTEEEVNSYLALELSPKYNPCLKSLQMTFEEGKLAGLALLDFDKLRTSSAKIMPRLLSTLFSGTHTLDARGQLLSRDGYANFRLEEARFDNSSLPNSLVEEIITSVGKRQNPPFDPLQPSKLPYKIEKVEIHQGYITVYQ